MFSMYEVAGVGTNLVAGLLGAKWGIRWTLLAGLTLQLVGLGALFGWQVRQAVVTAMSTHAPSIPGSSAVTVPNPDSDSRKCATREQMTEGGV
jgi:hypothetical protein